ncbi:MAG TPA: hypothetical protein VNN62_10630 [Methylomirabilota bacterium]|nr:hypothetical protein [Methylomirabilota bacterium]
MFQLTKVWVDQDPGIEMVEIRYLWSPLGEPAHWEGQEETEVMSVVPQTTPRVRQAVIEIPRYVNGKDAYQLHHRFVYVVGGREEFSPVYTEEIVAREVPYVDHEGRITEVRLLWGVNGWNAQNWTQATLEGLPLQTIPTRPGHDIEGEGLADDAMYELIQTVPLPRRYVAKVWGPRGAMVEYVYQLLRTNSPIPDDDFERWDNNNLQNYHLVLT